MRRRVASEQRVRGQEERQSRRVCALMCVHVCVCRRVHTRNYRPWMLRVMPGWRLQLGLEVTLQPETRSRLHLCLRALNTKVRRSDTKTTKKNLEKCERQS